MLYHLLYPLYTTHTFFNVFKYITFRTIYAIVTALMLSFILGPLLIRMLSTFQIEENIREDTPPAHLKKTGTPTMGGSLIVLSIIFPTLLWADLTNGYIWAALLITMGMAVVGFIDDYMKIRRKQGQGLGIRIKFLIQTVLALAVALFIFYQPAFTHELWVPFFKRVHPDIGLYYLLFATFVIIATSNSVNLTDGLDGLAIGPVMIASSCYMLLAYLAGHAKFAEYLKIASISGAGELAIFCGSMLGAGLGFLWFNAYPAQIFMGNIGSLALGGALGTIAVITKQELLLIIIGGIFVLEALSVIFQVTSYKLRRKRIFRMAPLHHHFELKGWAEPKIIVRFWIISVVLALIGISTLKLR